METLELLSNPKATKSLKRGLKEAKAGKFHSFKTAFGLDNSSSVSTQLSNSSTPITTASGRPFFVTTTRSESRPARSTISEN